ncbi:MAG: hypothetical protein J1F25_07385 [Prevotellaceae bacterium]|nr:hypothetical protein [Prevotellaceae bacterium]
MKTLLPALRHLFVGMCLCVAVLPVSAKSTKHTYTFTVGRTLTQDTPSMCAIHPNVLQAHLGVNNIMTALGNGTVQFYAIQATTGKFYSTSTLVPYGHYFNAAGVAVNGTSKNSVVSSQFKNGSQFEVNTIEGRIEDGSAYSFSQAFVNGQTADTVVYHFNVNIGATQYVRSDEPKIVHRADVVDSWSALPYVQQNDQAGELENFLQVNAGDRATFGLRPRNEGDEIRFLVKGPDGKTLRSNSSEDFTLTAVEPADAGVYSMTARYTPAGGKSSVEYYTFYLDVQTDQGKNYDWNVEVPRWSYDFRDEYPDGFPQPTKVHTFTQRNGKPANRYDGDWWTVYWGDNLNSEVDVNNKNAMTNMMKKYDTDFAYIRDEMGWPPDINARKGYKSFVYIFGSGLNRDNSSSTEQGGYQGYTGADDGGSWPCVWASYYPVSRFRDDADSKWGDGDYQREAMVHEGIHAIFADMDGVKKSSWFHEAGNVWLQMAMNAKRDGTYGAPGWLGIGNLICPFMPIECYSGWLLDGSFGGPAAEGVNMYAANGQQVCTWRNLIGGVQYGEIFPLFVGEAVGYGSVPWIWRYCSDYVLKGIALGNSKEGVSGIGDENMRRFIMHYRAKLATLDFGGFSEECRKMVDGNFGGQVRAEWRNGVCSTPGGPIVGATAGNNQMPCWIDVEPFTLTPYQTLTLNDEKGWLAPDTLTNPGWSGANILPIHVTGNHCEVFFRPEDSEMRAQLCYRTRTGECFYSQPVLCGKMELNWTSSTAPANGVVFAVVCNTDYIFTGDAQRKHHWDYRLKLGEGAVGVASKDIKWFNYMQTLRDTEFETGIEAPSAAEKGGSTTFRVLSTVLRAGGQVQLDLGGVPANEVQAHLVGAAGILLDSQTVSDAQTVQLPAFLPKGIYFLSLRHKGKVQTFKLFAQ